MSTILTNPVGSEVTERNVLHVCINAKMPSGLIERINQSSRFQLKLTQDKSVADLQLIDWCSFDTDNLSIQEQAELLARQQERPLLIIADDSAELYSVLEAPSTLDCSRLELANVDEVGSRLLDVRLLRLIQAENKAVSQRLLKDNAEIILETVMRHSNDWMVIKSLDHRFLQISKKFCHAHNLVPEAVVGRNDLEIGTSPELVLGRPGTEWKGFWALDKEVTDKGEHVVLQPVVMEEDEFNETRESTDKIPLRDRDGNVFALFVCVSELMQVKPEEGSVDNLSAEDFTSMRFWQSKENLKHSPALTELNKERMRVEALQHESERAFMAKNQFIAAASHDLRQPLHALGLYLGALEEKVKADKDEFYLVDKIKNCVGSLNELLTSLLDISRLDANVVSAELSSFSVDELLQSLLDECSSIAGGKSLKLSCKTDGSQIYSDPVLLRRVVRNLLINAINYTEQGKILLTAVRVGAHVKIDVVDTGIGIPEEKQELVFEEFAKLESRSHNSQQGLGLGLSIVKRLCLLLDIKVALHSTVNEGTRVTVMVPLGQLHSVEEAAQSEATNYDATVSKKLCTAGLSNRKKLVLIVDDDQEVCEAVETVLVHSGYRVVSAECPRQAIERLQASDLTPDAILVDFRLSEEMTGLDAIKIITDRLANTIPALIVTGDTTDDGLKEITGSGYRHLHKPVNVSELLKIVGEMVSPTVAGHAHSC